MLKLMRFLCALTLLVWLGAVITTTFYVAPSLFGNESGESPNSTIAANIIAPLLHKMEVTGWIALPIAMALHVGIWLALKRSASRALFISLGLLALAWLGGLYSGIALNRELHSIRSELKAELGGYHLAPPDHPEGPIRPPSWRLDDDRGLEPWVGSGLLLLRYTADGGRIEWGQIRGGR